MSEEQFVQLSMFKTSNPILEKVPSYKSGCNWYYVADRATQKMLTLDSEGKYIWVDDDTINLTPFVFNSKRQALQTASKFPGKCVKRYRWNN